MVHDVAGAVIGPEILIAAAAVIVAGLVYGFAGFGAALVAVPVLSTLYTPADAVGILALSGLSALLTVVPRAWAKSDRTATAHLLGAAIVTVPVGLYVLRHAPGEVLRWVICSLVLATLVALMMGWRRQGADRVTARLGIGAATGVVGGATGLTGPVVVLFQLSGRHDAERARANIVLFLSLLSVLMVPLLIVGGVLGVHEATLGAVLLPFYAAATRVGQAWFRPENERAYRVVAYSVVAAAGVAGLPVWG